MGRGHFRLFYRPCFSCKVLESNTLRQSEKERLKDSHDWRKEGGGRPANGRNVNKDNNYFEYIRPSMYSMAVQQHQELEVHTVN